MRSLLPADRWARIETLFEAGLDLPPGQREAFLEEQCRGDSDLLAEVLSLLHQDTLEEPRLLNAIGAGAASILAGNAAPGKLLGPYRIECEIGRGGMSVVYLAGRADGEFEKRVAVKLVKRGMDSASVIERLRRERRILAGLEHPSIARLLDGGTTADGQPWIAMEYIEGLPIDRYCEDHRLTVEEKCALLLKVCDAVAYAHRHLVVHRDLKPTNILIASGGFPKLLDFGIAKLLGENEGGEEDPLTRLSSLPLTPEYASPEQIQGATVTTASDVYSLGVVLYQLLTGERPPRLVTEPKKPSTVETLAGKTRRQLSGDIDNIVLKALREDPSRRYGSAEQLAQDLQRHLQGQPVEARPDTLLYRTGKFLNRNRAGAAAAFLVAASVVIGTVIDLRQAHATRQRFDELRGFARTVLVDLNAQLSDIPGTAKARQALVTYVDGYLKRVAAQHAGDDQALATEFATTYLRLGEIQGTTHDAIVSFENGRQLLERKGRASTLGSADRLVLARLRVREGSTLLDLGQVPAGVENLSAGTALANQLHGVAGLTSEAELVKVFAGWRLARLYRQQNRLHEAEEQARTSVGMAEELLSSGLHTKELYAILTGARNVLASAQRRQGHWMEGLATYQKVLADTEQRAMAEPGSASLQRELARSHQILGDMLVRMAGHDEDQVRYHARSAIAIAERLAALDPWDKTAQEELAQYLSSGAEALRRPEDSGEVLGYMRRALPLFDSLLKSEPGNGELRLYAALTEADLGEYLSREAKHAEALAWLRRGLADLTRLVESSPTNMTNRMELVRVDELLGLSLARARQGTEALALGQTAIAQARRLAGDMVATPESARELPRAYSAMAATCTALGKRAEARTWYQAASAEWDKLLAKGLPPVDSEDEIADARKGAALPPLRL